MKKILTTALLLLFSGAMKGFSPYRRESMDLARLKMSLLYIKSVETFRLLFVSLLGIGLCLIFLLGGLVLFHVALFAYTPWTNEAKLYMGLTFSAVYLIIAVGAFSYVFSQQKWLEIFHADKICDDAAKNESPSEKSSGSGSNGDRYSQTQMAGQL